jgi:hypothetical protein
MQKSTLAVAVGAIVLVAAAAPAQDTARVRVPDTTRAVSRGDVAAAPTFAGAIAAIHASPQALAKLAAVTEVKDGAVTFVNVRDLTAGTLEADFTAALAKNQATIDSLRAAITARQDLNKAFAAHAAKPSVSDVVALDVLADGTLWIYFRTKQ